MRTTEHIEQFRLTDGDKPQFNTTTKDGMNGIFQMPYEKGRVQFFCIVSDGTIDPGLPEKIEWEHVSVRARYKNTQGKWTERVPNWEEMCWIKNLFWREDECVVQFHPAQKDYVNIHPNVLHLWKWTGGEFPTPPTICV